tara:strand:- start:256 stop:564 length:309 start_codon:yes stop_codon:yes gene_type:complete
MVGPINKVMGGNPDPDSGGGSGVTITNNVDGYILKATGTPNTIEGIPQLTWDSSNVALSASADMYVSGSNNYLYLHGTNSDGQVVRFKVSVEGSILKVADDT